MAGPVSVEKQTAAMREVLRCLRMPVSDVAGFDVSFTGNQEFFVARIDFPAHRGGGYQIFEGCIGVSANANASTPVLGKGRVTPHFPLRVSTAGIEAKTELERRVRLQLEYEQEYDSDRVS